MGKYRFVSLTRTGLFCLLFSFSLVVLSISGCAQKNTAVQEIQVDSTVNLKEERPAYRDFSVTLERYSRDISRQPEIADRLLFEMGIIYSHPLNIDKDYPEALRCFQRIVDDYPASTYRSNSQMMVFHIKNVQVKDDIIARQKEQVEASGQKIKKLNRQISNLQQALNAVVSDYMLNADIKADQVLIEKKKRKLTLLLKEQPLKSYRVALGRNPVGAKVKQGDKKTPEGRYYVENRNTRSKYHLALRLSYPNEKDIKRAGQLGVSPGGDIMIHGLQEGNVGPGFLHTATDWTEGCIAVTNEEIEEIARLVEDGTLVEIRP
jgi:L,D-peptidoglycan transpeptidase YkuD (ErfK/YbiS/YcfS/YnhG family)